MKKRTLLCVAVVLIAVLAMGTIAFAADSPAGEAPAAGEGAPTGDAAADVTSAVGANGQPVAVVVNNVSQETQTEELKSFDTQKYSGAKTLAVYDISAPEGWNGEPVTLTVKVPNVKAGEKVLIGHYKDGAWEYIDASKVADGEVTFTTDSFSSFYFFVLPASSSNAAKSPKTGEADMALILAVLASAAAASVVFAGRKLSTQK